MEEMIESILFREMNMEDVESLFDIYSDKEAMKYRGSKPMESIDDAKKYVINQILKEDQIVTIRQGVELVNSKELIGSVMIRYHEANTKECEIGYSIGRQFWGKGLGKEIVRTLLKVVQEKNKVEVVIANSNKENLASIKILEQLGFTQIPQNTVGSNYFFRKVVK